MIYTEENIDEITRLASLNLNPSKIAVYLRIPEQEFIKDITGGNEKAKYAYDKGIIQHEIDEKAEAKRSPKAADSQHKRRLEAQYNQDLKELYDFDTSRKVGRPGIATRFLDYTSEEIQRYRVSGESEIIAVEDQALIDQISSASQLFVRNQNVSSCAHKLMEQYPELKLSAAKQRVYQSVEFFHINVEVSNKAWDNHFASVEYPKLRELALKKGDLELAFKITAKIHEVRTKYDDDSIPEELLELRPTLISPEFNLDRLGIEPRTLKSMFNDSIEMINGFPITKDEKVRLKTELSSELNIEDVDIID